MAEILVVDDDVGMLTVLRHYLRREGYEVTTAPSAATALQRPHGHKGQAAALLGIHPRTLTRMMRRYGMPDAL